MMTLGASSVPFDVSPSTVKDTAVPYCCILHYNMLLGTLLLIGHLVTTHGKIKYGTFAAIV